MIRTREPDLASDLSWAADDAAANCPDPDWATADYYEDHDDE